MFIDSILKSSWKSLEGQSHATIIISCLYFLYIIISGDNAVDPAVIDKLLANAKSANDIADIYKEMTTSIDVNKLGLSGGLLSFLYYILSRFTRERSAIKKDELKIRYNLDNPDKINYEIVNDLQQKIDAVIKENILLQAQSKNKPVVPPTIK